MLRIFCCGIVLVCLIACQRGEAPNSADQKKQVAQAKKAEPLSDVDTFPVLHSSFVVQEHPKPREQSKSEPQFSPRTLRHFYQQWIF